MVDLFSGAGGLSLGLIQSGFESLLAVDSDQHACRTYELNIGRIIKEDLARVTTQFICEAAHIGQGQLDLVCGGPPCQGFSVQRRGDREDHRNELVTRFAELAVGIRPRAILMENVPGLLGIRGRAEYETFCRVLTDSGYCIKARTLDAADYGAPQHRIRAFVVGWLPEAFANFDFPAASHREGTWKTVRDSIADLPEPPNDYTEHPDYPNHVKVHISPLNEQRISHIPPGGGRTDLPSDLQLPCHRKDNGHRHLDVYGRLYWDRPAGTITAMFDNFTRGRFAHPERNRSITNREGARLQTFPDRFLFTGPKKDVARQIGNAVPPLMGAILGGSILAALEGIDAEANPQRGLALQYSWALGRNDPPQI
jgi:DNA (cytosine-5)-methyltransferase 1